MGNFCCYFHALLIPLQSFLYLAAPMFYPCLFCCIRYTYPRSQILLSFIIPARFCLKSNFCFILVRQLRAIVELPPNSLRSCESRFLTSSSLLLNSGPCAKPIPNFSRSDQSMSLCLQGIMRFPNCLAASSS